MIQAVKAVKESKMGTLAASKKFKVPRTTLRDYLKSDKSPAALVQIPLGRKPILNSELEKSFADYCVAIDKRFFGLRRNDVKRMGFQLAIKNKRPHPFKNSNAKFFDLYKVEFEKVKRQPHRIFNVDETGICTVQHKMSKVVTFKGKKEVAALTSAERRKLVTVVVCMNAVGTYIPPLLIWPRKNMKPELMNGAPAGSIWACHPSGWIQSNIFTVA